MFHAMQMGGSPTEVAKKGIDGKKLASEARALIAKYNR